MASGCPRLVDRHVFDACSSVSAIALCLKSASLCTGEQDGPKGRPAAQRAANVQARVQPLGSPSQEDEGAFWSCNEWIAIEVQVACKVQSRDWEGPIHCMEWFCTFIDIRSPEVPAFDTA